MLLEGIKDKVPSSVAETDIGRKSSFADCNLVQLHKERKFVAGFGFESRFGNILTHGVAVRILQTDRRSSRAEDLAVNGELFPGEPAAFSVAHETPFDTNIEVPHFNNGAGLKFFADDGGPAVFGFLFDKLVPCVIRLCDLDGGVKFSSAGEVHSKAVPFDLRHGAAGDLRFSDPHFTGDDTGFENNAAVPLVIILSGDGAQIADRTGTGEHDLVHGAVGVLAGKEKLHKVILPHGVFVKFALDAEHFRCMGLIGFDAHIEVILIGKHTDTGVDLHLLFGAGEHPDGVSIFPDIFRKFSVDGDVA